MHSLLEMTSVLQEICHTSVCFSLPCDAWWDVAYGQCWTQSTAGVAWRHRFWQLNFGRSSPLCCDLLLPAVLGWCWLCLARAPSLFWLCLSPCVRCTRLCLHLSLAVTHSDYPSSLSAPACHSTQTTCCRTQKRTRGYFPTCAQPSFVQIVRDYRDYRNPNKCKHDKLCVDGSH